LSDKQIIEIKKKIGDDALQKLEQLKESVITEKRYEYSLNEIFSLREKIKQKLNQVINEELKLFRKRQEIAKRFSREKTWLGVFFNFAPNPYSFLSILTDPALDIVVNVTAGKPFRIPAINKFIEKVLVNVGNVDLIKFFQEVYLESLFPENDDL
jgi:hypothetical protein